MEEVAFILTAGFYFWTGPVLIAFFARKFVNRMTPVCVMAFPLAVALVSWLSTVALASVVMRFAKSYMDADTFRFTCRFGWAYLPVTSIPAFVCYGVAALVVRDGKWRFLIGCIAMSIPFAALCCWYLPQVSAIK